MTTFSYDIQTSIDIAADAGRLWQLVTDFERYAEWNPMLADVHAHLEPEAQVRFKVLREGASPLKLRARIVELVPTERLAWRGGTNALISGEHYFRIERLDSNRCRFHHGEHFKGILLPLFRPMLKNASALYESMNKELKVRAEGADAGPQVAR